MTDAELGEIEARCKAATPGPWWRHANGIRAMDGIYEVALFDSYGLEKDANGNFAAHAREDVPMLLAEVRSLKARGDGERAAERDRIAGVLRAACYCGPHVDRCMYCQILPTI